MSRRHGPGDADSAAGCVGQDAWGRDRDQLGQRQRAQAMQLDQVPVVQHGLNAHFFEETLAVSLIAMKLWLQDFYSHPFSIGLQHQFCLGQRKLIQKRVAQEEESSAGEKSRKYNLSLK